MVDETWTVEKGYNRANQYVEDMEIPFLKIEDMFSSLLFNFDIYFFFFVFFFFYNKL